MRPDPATDAPARSATVRQLEASAQKAQKERGLAWQKVMAARAALSAALDNFNDRLGHETAAFQALCAARQAKAPEPLPPAPETLTALDEED